MDDGDGTLAGRVDAYIEGLFVPKDPALEQGLADAAAAGLPDIAVSANEGKLIHLLARLVRPRRILEIGTLGGYSTAWLARALEPHGRLVTLEIDGQHAEVARRNLARAGLDDRVEVRVGPAQQALRTMIASAERPYDVVFIDADKDAYPGYLELSLQLARPGSLILADNVVRDGAVLAEDPADAYGAGVRAFNAALAAHPRLDSIIVPIYRERLDGLSISIVRG
ncbi:MAG TPA: O-methyltransferase [Anaeromyxobacter sp.]|nr:O-methyltransferase [Anaeromyxobacter sp.]